MTFNSMKTNTQGTVRVYGLSTMIRFLVGHGLL